MAHFGAHIALSGTLGIGYGLAGYACGMPATTAAVGASLCTIGGMLPDMDGETATAPRELIPLMAAAVPILMLDTFRHWGFDRESIFLAAGALYLFIRFGLGELFIRWTRHRGMWHSIPAALNVGLITLLICGYQENGPRIYKACAICLGYLSHLLLDEIWCIDLLRFRLKNSCGTALKFFTPRRLWPNILTYGITAMLVVLIYKNDEGLSTGFHALRKGEKTIDWAPDWDRFSRGQHVGAESADDPGDDGKLSETPPTARSDERQPAGMAPPSP